MKIKPLVLGTEVFSGDWGEKFDIDQAKKILVFANNIIEELDTAYSYGKQNSVEKLLGQLIKKNNLNFKISSKFRVNKKKLTISEIVKNIEKQLDATLNYLNTDNIETYYFHSGENDEFFIDEVWEYLNNRKKKGDINELGLSIKHDLVVNNDIKQIINSKKYEISKIQTVLNIFSKESLNFVIPYCIKNNIDIYGRMPLAKGLLSGKYSDEKNFKKNDPRKVSKFTKEILSFRNDNKDLNISEIIKWPLNYVKKIVFSVKNTDQLREIINISYDKK